MPKHYIAGAGINKLVSLTPDFCVFLLTDHQQDYFHPYIGGPPEAPRAFH